MIKAHAPFQDGSKHAANEYCPTCHGPFQSHLWDSAGMFKPEAQCSLYDSHFKHCALRHKGDYCTCGSQSETEGEPRG